MAYAARISALDDLITATTSASPQEGGRQFKQFKESALKTLKAHQHGRVNQFDIDARLEGLVEKFFVLNNEPLANALKLRLDELAARSSKWRPEILALLLGLSDRPVEKTNIDEALRVNVPEPEPQLTWAEIIADDPLTEEGVWDDVEIESDYSDHHAPSVSDISAAEQTTSTQASSVGEEDIAVFARTFVLPPDTQALNQVKALRARLTALNSEPELTELQATRQVLAMLHGLPSDLFDTSGIGQIRLRSACRIANIAPSTTDRIIRSFAITASQLFTIRKWVSSPQTSVVLQRFQVAIEQRLHNFKRVLSDLEQAYITPGSTAVVSIESVFGEVDRISEPLVRLAQMLPDQSLPPNIRTSHVLNRLFEEAGTLHLIGEEQEFVSVARLFFECLEVYLRPVQLWMTEGKIQDSDLFFVRSSDENTDRGSIWHSRFTVARNVDGSICTPIFMQQFAERIFKAGKSVTFLEALGQGPEKTGVTSVHHSFDTNHIISSMVDTLLPFSEIFNDSLVQWIDGLEGPGTQTLRQILVSQCGLQATVRSIDNLYLGRHGAQFQAFACGLFARMDRGSGWDDRFLLTELAQSAFGVVDGMDTNHISIRITPTNSKETAKSTRRRSDLLDSVVLDYSITWPLQNILTADTLSTCQKVFSTLLRVYRAQYLLTQQEWSLSIVAGFTKEGQVRHILALRQHLAWLVGIIRSHISEMVSLATKQLSVDLVSATDVDDMATAFDKFQHDLAGKLLLKANLEPIRQSLLSLLDLCEDFAVAWRDMIKRISEHTAEPTSRHLAVQHVRQQVSNAADTADLSADEDEILDDDIPTLSVSNTSDLLGEYRRQFSFALAGLRSVSRVGGEAAWIMLSERLQWGSASVEK